MKNFLPTMVSVMAARLLLAFMCILIIVTAVSYLERYRPASTSSETDTVAVPDPQVWLNLNHPGGSVNSLAIDPRRPTTVYIGTVFGGMAGSDDYSRSWTGINFRNKYGPLEDVRTIVVDPKSSSTIYTGAMGGLVRSNNRGTTWIVCSGLGNGIVCLAIDPKETKRIYAGTLEKGVFRSDDGGVHWQKMSAGLPGDQIRCIDIDPKQTSVVFAGTDHGIYRSENRGLSWSESSGGVFSGEPVSSIVVDPSNASTVYAGTGDDLSGVGVFRNDSSGSNWISVSLGLTNLQVNCLALT
jgi:hypothetical protein